LVAGRPADSAAHVAAALEGLDGVDVDALVEALEDPEVLADVRSDHAETRDPHPAVIGRTGPGPNPGAAKPDGDRLRYGFPTLIVRGSGREDVLSGWLGTEELERAVVRAGAQRVSTTALDPDEALERYGSLTERELAVLAGGGVPAQATRVATPTGALLRRGAAVGAV
jgi:hypothetical protein